MNTELATEPIARRLEIPEHLCGRSNDQVSQRVLSQSLDRERSRERARERNVVTGEGDQRTSQVADCGAATLTSQLSRGAAVVGDRDDHRQGIGVVTQCPKHRGDAVAAADYGHAPLHGRELFHGHGLREVPWLIDVQRTGASEMVGKQLQRNDREHNLQERVGDGDVDDVLGMLGDLLATFARDC